MILNQLRHLRLVMALLILWACSSVAKAQTNAQILYDFGSDRKFVTLTLEMFKQDKWGVLISLLTTISTTTKW